MKYVIPANSLVGQYVSKEIESTLSHEELIERNIPFALKQAKQFAYQYHLNEDDCISEAMFAMVAAADHFNPKKNTKFITLAQYYIFDILYKYKIHYGRGQAKQSRHYFFLNKKINRFVEDYKKIHKYSPSDNQICTEFKIKPKVLSKILESSKVRHYNIDDAEVTNWVEFQYENNKDNPETHMMYMDIFDQINKIFKEHNVPKRNSQIFKDVVVNGEKGVDAAKKYKLTSSSITVIVNGLKKILQENLQIDK